MKIGLISINTRVVSLNFACPLHTYAFQQFLLEHGIETTVIDYKPIYYNKSYDPKHPLFSYLKRGFANGFNSDLLLSNKSGIEQSESKDRLDLRRELVKQWIDMFDEREIRFNRFQEFVENNYTKTEECYNHELLDQVDPGFDCYICVTDVIWKDNPGYGFDKGFFLACRAMDGKKKIAYSASRGPFFGWSEETTQQFKNYIQPFDFISVRENSLKEYIESVSDKKAEVVLDPVLLQGRDFYHRLAIPPKEKGYVLLYDVMEKATDSIVHAVRFAQSRGLKLIELSDRMDHAYIPDGTYHEVRYGLGIEEWLGYIEYADYMFTNSFHGSCLAILFEKEFYVGKREGDKVDTLLNTLGLSDRRLDPKTDVTTMPVTPIDYEPVRKILDEKRKASEAFILNAIHSVEKDLPQKPNNIASYRVFYHSGASTKEVSKNDYKNTTKIVKTARGAWECQDYTLIENGSPYQLKSNGFSRKGYLFLGWNGRVIDEQKTLWYCSDGDFHTTEDISKDSKLDKYLFLDNETITELPFPQKLQDSDFSFIMEAVWVIDTDSISQPTRQTAKKKRQVQSELSNKYHIIYHSGANAEEITSDRHKLREKLISTTDGACQWQDHNPKENGMSYNLKQNLFQRQGYAFLGWNGRIMHNQQTLWYCTDRNFHTEDEITEISGLNKYLFHNNRTISNLPFPEDMLDKPFSFVMEAVWANKDYYTIYHSGTASSDLAWEYTEQHGTMKKTPKGCWEYCYNRLMDNEKPYHLQVNRFYRKGFVFSGWNARVFVGKNCWYCTDGSFHSSAELKQNPELKKYIFYDADTIYHLPMPKHGSNKLVFEAIWKRG